MSGRDALPIRADYPVGEDWKTYGQAVQVTRMPKEENSFYSVASVTRLDNTTAYDVGDVVGGRLHFTRVGPPGGLIWLTDLILRVDVASVPSGMTYFTLYLYHMAPDVIADNAAWSFTANNRGRYVRPVTIPVPVDLGATLSVDVNSINKKIKLTGTDLWAYLVTPAAYTPTALAVKTIEMFTDKA